MTEQRPPSKKSSTKKIMIITIVAAAAAGGTFAWMNRDTDPTTFKGERSGYEETK